MKEGKRLMVFSWTTFHNTAAANGSGKGYGFQGTVLKASDRLTATKPLAQSLRRDGAVGAVDNTRSREGFELDLPRRNSSLTHDNKVES